jgi:TM2 domain-containing membrane protein YozV
MTTEASKIAAPLTAQKSSLPILVLVAGWLVPGAGHFLLGKWVRGTLIFAAILGMYLLGLGLQGKIFVPNSGDILDILGFLGQIGMGMGYFLARLFGWGASSVLITLGDYGTKFLTVAGLLNIIAAVDAHSLANGRKAS